HRSRGVHSLPSLREKQDGAPLCRYFANGFKGEIVSVDVKGVQEISSQLSVSQFSSSRFAFFEFQALTAFLRVSLTPSFIYLPAASRNAFMYFSGSVVFCI